MVLYFSVYELCGDGMIFSHTPGKFSPAEEPAHCAPWAAKQAMRLSTSTKKHP
jgi:hypothetical protein